MSKSITIKFWALNEQLVFPEVERLSEKADIGIALPGGGMRAAVLAFGWLQVFHELGLLDKVKYISSVSGGGWTSTPMVNSSIDMDTYLGKLIPLDECTIDTVKKYARKKGSHLNVLTVAKFSKISRQ